MDGPGLLEQLNRSVRELAAIIRPEVAGAEADEKDTNNVCILAADDLAPDNLLDTHAAQERFGYPQDTIRKWCRTEGLGVMRGGRWLVSVPRLRQRLNGR